MLNLFAANALLKTHAINNTSFTVYYEKSGQQITQMLLHISRGYNTVGIEKQFSFSFGITIVKIKLYNIKL